MTSPAHKAVDAHGKIWIGSPDDVRFGAEASDALEMVNDSEYWDPNVGIITVPPKRWEEAQEYEKYTWTNSSINHDRNHEHKAHFNNYEKLPTKLGHVLEIGCGPFTQLKTILEDRAADKITLLDPLINIYNLHQRY